MKLVHGSRTLHLLEFSLTAVLLLAAVVLLGLAVMVLVKTTANTRRRSGH